MLWAALLAAPVALASAQPARAQCASGCGPTGQFNAWRPGAQVPPFGSPGGFSFRLFPGLHQHGPLVNYGPYSGYYPFEPYGPWTSDLRYTGPTGATGSAFGFGGHLSQLFHRGYFRRGAADCGSCGQYALTTLRNVASRLNPRHRFGCGTGCGS
jgi:hypothetical protein